MPCMHDTSTAHNMQPRACVWLKMCGRLCLASFYRHTVGTFLAGLNLLRKTVDCGLP